MKNRIKNLIVCKYCNRPISKVSFYYGNRQCRHCQNRKFYISKKRLFRLYIIQKKSITSIAKILKFNYVTIFIWLKKYAIKMRTRRESHLGKIRPNHSKRMTGKGNPMYGKKRPLYVRRKISQSRKGKYRGKNSPAFGRKPSYKCSYGKGGRYKNEWFRSSYEIAYAKYLDKRDIKWQYEPRAFDLGDTTYRPDFYLPKSNTWIEIKGYWTEEAKIKFLIFKKLYKQIKIKILEQKQLIKMGVL